MPRQRPSAVPKHAANLAATVWNAVAERRIRRLRDVVSPGSPAAALCRLYGVDGPRYAVGVPPDEHLTRFTSGSTWLGDGTGYTGGAVTTDARDYPYALVWRAVGQAVSLVEVLAYAPLADLHLSGFYWMFRGWHRVSRAPVDVPGLDDVERLLVSVGVPTHGLSVTARALAAWGRVDDALIPPGQPGAMAAAIHRLVASRAGGPGRFREVADAFQVEETAIRRADAPRRPAGRVPLSGRYNSARHTEQMPMPLRIPSRPAAAASPYRDPRGIHRRAALGVSSARWRPTTGRRRAGRWRPDRVVVAPAVPAVGQYERHHDRCRHQHDATDRQQHERRPAGLVLGADRRHQGGG